MSKTIIAIIIIVTVGLGYWIYQSTLAPKPETCAKEGEQFSSVYRNEHPEYCCQGLTEWHSGFDTSISIADECYETGVPAGLPVGTCINCGNEICEDIEDICNCLEDCKGKNKSDFLSIEEFCQSEDWNQTFSEACEGTIKDFPMCELCMVPVPPIEPVSGETTIKGYVYDDKLGYGFEYPGGWEFYINVDKDIEQCDPSLYYENYNCVDFPDENIKKVVSFEKKIPKNGQSSVEIGLIVKSATNLEEVKNEFKKELEMSGIPILGETIVSVNNIGGYDILSGTPTWKLRQAAFFADGTAYIFKCTAQEEFYRIHEETFNNVINSFNIK